MKREYTSKINWILDNLVPPILMDCRPITKFIYRFAYGKKTDIVIDFKKKLPFLSETDISAMIADVSNRPKHVRPTDLHKKAVNFILENLVGKSVLDAGCGRGYLLRTISAANASLEIAGMDVKKSEFIVPDIRFIQGSVTDIPLPDNAFDTVVCSHVLEHVIESQKALAELKRVARKRLIVVVPQQREYLYAPDFHVNFFPYLYAFQRFMREPVAKYRRFGVDLVCVVNMEPAEPPER
jgi:SAM-dependent methyltransferase